MSVVEENKTLAINIDERELALHYEIAFHFVMKDVQGISEESKERILETVNSIGYGKRSYFDEVYDKFFKGIDFKWAEYNYWCELFESENVNPPNSFFLKDLITPKIADYISTLSIKYMQSILDDNQIPYKKNLKKREYIELIANSNFKEIEEGFKEYQIEINEYKHYALYQLLMETINRRAMNLRSLNKEKIGKLGVKYKLLSAFRDEKYNSLVVSEIVKRDTVLIPIVPCGDECLKPVFSFEENYKNALDLSDKLPSLNIINKSKENKKASVISKFIKFFRGR